MEITIYVRLIEGTENYVPVTAIEESNAFRIEENKYFEKDDFTSLWEFIPGDLVQLKEKSINNELVKVGNKFIGVMTRERRLLWLQFKLALNELTQKDIINYSHEINELKSKIKADPTNFHPAVKRAIKI